MATPDLDVIKEIPGYKVILKAVLKSQIQQLVEQLASHTDEESVILTANVSDGTLSHLGSDSGKFFLENHEDIKSQFLGFCLKRSHEKKLTEESECMTVPHPVGLSINQVQRSLAGQQFFPSKTVQRTARNRPQPYKRINRKPVDFNSSIVTSTPKPNHDSMQGTTIKIERNSSSDEEDSACSNQDASLSCINQNPNDSSKVKTEKAENSVSDQQKLSRIQVGLNLESDLSDLTGVVSNAPGTNETRVNSGTAENVEPIVKLEVVSDSEKDLEIIGIEPGQPVLGIEQSQSVDSNWGPESSTGHSWPGGADSQADVQGYNVQSHTNTYIQTSPGQSISNNNIFISKLFHVLAGTSMFRCNICGKMFNRKLHLENHSRIHTGEQPFQCRVCKRRFNMKGNLRRHMLTHLNLQ